MLGNWCTGTIYIHSRSTGEHVMMRICFDAFHETLVDNVMVAIHMKIRKTLVPESEVGHQYNGSSR